MKQRQDETDSVRYRQQIDDAVCYLVGGMVVCVAAPPLHIYFALRARSGPTKRSDRHPPESAEYLLSFFLPRDTREPLIGDLNEEYQLQRIDYGAPAARMWYWAQTIRVIGKSPALLIVSRVVRYSSVLGAISALRKLI